MPEQDPDQLADELEHEADRLQLRSDEVKERVDSARQDWERKRRDESVPGAAPPSPDEEDSSEGAADDAT